MPGGVQLAAAPLAPVQQPAAEAFAAPGRQHAALQPDPVESATLHQPRTAVQPISAPSGSTTAEGVPAEVDRGVGELVGDVVLVVVLPRRVDGLDAGEQRRQRGRVGPGQRAQRHGVHAPNVRTGRT